MVFNAGERSDGMTITENLILIDMIKSKCAEVIPIEHANYQKKSRTVHGNLNLL